MVSGFLQKVSMMASVRVCDGFCECLCVFVMVFVSVYECL